MEPDYKIMGGGAFGATLASCERLTAYSNVRSKIGEGMFLSYFDPVIVFSKRLLKFCV